MKQEDYHDVTMTIAQVYTIQNVSSADKSIISRVRVELYQSIRCDIEVQMCDEKVCFLLFFGEIASFPNS